MTKLIGNIRRSIKYRNKFLIDRWYLNSMEKEVLKQEDLK